MLAMLGLRAFSLAAGRSRGGVSCDADGAFVDDIPLLQRGGAENPCWSVRRLPELNKQLTDRYQLPIDISAKASALVSIADALNRGDLVTAAIATVQMQFPDPPPVAKGAETVEQIKRRAAELHRSCLFKADWDPAKHPRAGTPPNPGEFAPTGEESESARVIPAATVGKPWEKPAILEGGGGGGVPRGTLELPFPSGLPRFRWPWQSSPEPPVAETKPPIPSEKPATLPFMEEQPPQLAPFAGGKTSGIFRAGDVRIELQSGYDGPAAAMPPGSAGFDGYTSAHVEGHAAALMQQLEISEAWLEINNPEICVSCMQLLPKMLPSGSTLHVVLPNRTIVNFEGFRP
jgi:Double-stranded DNA deaminase toxin A